LLKGGLSNLDPTIRVCDQHKETAVPADFIADEGWEKLLERRSGRGIRQIPEGLSTLSIEIPWRKKQGHKTNIFLHSRKRNKTLFSVLRWSFN